MKKRCKKPRAMSAIADRAEPRHRSQLCGTQTVAHAHDGPWHLVAEVIDHMDQIAAVVVRGCYDASAIHSRLRLDLLTVIS